MTHMYRMSHYTYAILKLTQVVLCFLRVLTDRTSFAHLFQETLRDHTQHYDVHRLRHSWQSVPYHLTAENRQTS